MSTRDTRSVILDTAVHLFNQHGTQNVSTNRIAAEMSISVGNLYYHFGDKEEIIRSLFDRMVAEEDELWSEKGDPSISGLRETIARQIKRTWKYRFFQREQMALLNKDPLLSKSNRIARRRRREQMEASLSRLVDANVLNQLEDPELLTELTKALSILGENWVAYLEFEGKKVNQGNIDAGADLAMRILQPYLIPAS